jgi:hypothetical protein
MATTKVTKKEIVRVLRSEDRTEIFKLFKRINGYIDRHDILNFIKRYAPTQKIERGAWDMVYKTRKYFVEDCYKGKHGYFEPLRKHYIVEYLKDQINSKIDNYTKVPIYGNSGLYFCSMVYGHQDYNKWRAIDIKNNERFCELVISVAHKHFSY